MSKSGIHIEQMSNGVVIGSVQSGGQVNVGAPTRSPAPGAASPLAAQPTSASARSEPSDEPDPKDRAPSLASRVRVGILTALPKELAAVKALLIGPVEHTVSGRQAGRSYWLGEMPAKGGQTHVVAVAMTGAGDTQSSARATLLLEHFPTIEVVLMVGIAGAVPNPAKAGDHVRLGDIVVCSGLGVIQYDFIKETPTRVEHRHAPRPPSPRLLEADAALQMKEIEDEYPWLPHIGQVKLKGGGRPGEAADVLHDSADPAKVVPHPVDNERTTGVPRVFRGPIGASQTLLKNPKRRDALRDTFGIKAVEMESAGVAHAAWLGETGYFVVRGTCDYCDTHKNDDWQVYAAVIAAAYARALLGEIQAFLPAQKNPHAAVPRAAPAPAAAAPAAAMVPAIQADLVYLAAPADSAHLADLRKHLNPLLRRLHLTDWHVENTPPGIDHRAALLAAAQQAKIVLLLVTPDYLVDADCRAAEALALSASPKKPRVVPISVRPIADWSKEPFGPLTRLPRGKGEQKPVSDWSSRDGAWVDVVMNLRPILE